jgi:hypothetical protein
MLDYVWIGWCREGTHDKVWGIIRLKSDDVKWYAPCKFVTFWGRRGHKINYKIWNGTLNECNKQIGDKQRKSGYKEISQNRLHEVYPEFEQDLENTTIFAVLSS